MYQGVLRLSAAFLAVLEVAAPAGAAGGETTVFDYEVIAVRRASDAAGGPDDPSAEGLLGRTLTLGPTLQWLDGRECDDWSVRGAPGPVVWIEDPLLSDVQIGPPQGDPPWPDHRLNLDKEVLCGEKVMGRLLQVDDRVLVMSSASGLSNIILERPLDKEQVGKLQGQLKSMKFYGGEVTGRMDHRTRRAAAFYAEYLGAAYAFEAAAITENLLEGLGILSPDDGSIGTGEGNEAAELDVLKIVYNGPIAAHFMGVAEPLGPRTYGVREIWFSFESDPAHYRFDPSGELFFSDWYIGELFSPEGNYVLLLQDHFGPYHVVQVAHLRDYLTNKMGPDQVMGYEPEAGSPRGVHEGAKWLSEAEVQYGVTCCGNSMIRIEKIEIPLPRAGR